MLSTVRIQRLQLPQHWHQMKRLLMSTESSQQIPKIAICGSGISGLTLAGILSNTLGSKVHIQLFERASQDRDQGYGLDLDEHGQEALVKAGVYHRYWDFSRPYSDTAVAYHQLDNEKPIAIIFRPKFLMKYFPSKFAARPESNRSKLREILLESMANRKQVDIQFNVKVNDIRHVEEKNTTPTTTVSPSSSIEQGMSKEGYYGNKAELLDEKGHSLGSFDLIIDSMGLHSTLRQFRVNDPIGKHYTGELMIHGVVESPEDSWSKELLQKFSDFGTMLIPGRGYALLFQRFGIGSGSGDNRTCMFYMKTHETGEETIFNEMNIPKPISRSNGIIRDIRTIK